MAGIWGDGQRGGIFGAKVDPRLLAKQRIAEAFAASEGMQEPSQALYAAKHRRAQEGQLVEPGFWSDLASLGPRAVGGAQKMWQAAPAAAEALYNDPLGSINSAGLAGQAATDAVLGGMVKPFTQFGDPNVDPAQQGADLALAAMGGSAAIPAEENALRMGIKAYHGSPHDFERFDASKIGTGEGAQAYGHGLYFAEREGVAKDYRKKLASGADTPQFSDNVPQNVRDAVTDMHEHLGSSKNYADYGAGEVLDAFKRGDWSHASNDVNEAIKQGIASGDISMKPAGKMYEVDIAADPEHFLDWDKPLSEQSPQVRGSLEPLGIKYDKEGMRAHDDALLAALQDKGPTSLPKQPPNPAGEQIYRQAAKEVYAIRGAKDQRWEPTGKSFEESLAMVGGDHSRVLRMRSGGGKDSADALREAGIPGIRYLDQGSRAKGDVLAGDGKPTGSHNIDQELVNVHGGSWEAFKAAHPNPTPQLKKAIDKLDARGGVKFHREAGTSNYVVFDDKLISILRKYGLPISAAGLAALSQLHPQEAQAAQKRGKLPKKREATK